MKLDVPCVSQSNPEVFAQQVTWNTYMILNLNDPFKTDKTTLFLEYFAEVEAYLLKYNRTSASVCYLYQG